MKKGQGQGSGQEQGHGRSCLSASEGQRSRFRGTTSLRPDRLSKEALAVALREINPVISLQTTQVTARSSIEAQRSLVELGLSRHSFFSLLLQRSVWGWDQTAGQRLRRRGLIVCWFGSNRVPARILAFFSQGPSWNWRLVKSPLGRAFHHHEHRIMDQDIAHTELAGGKPNLGAEKEVKDAVTGSPQASETSPMSTKLLAILAVSTRMLAT